MQEPGEDALSMAARHVMEGEERVVRQEILLDKLVRHGHGRAAAEARRVLETLRETLRLSREHLRIEQEKRRT